MENNSFEGLAERIASSFIPGAEPEESLITSIDPEIASYSSIASSRCTCGFVYYYITSPDLFTAKLTCPGCKKQIENPTLYQNIGVSHPPHQKTAEYLLPFNINDISRRNHSFRSIKPLTYRVLSLIMHSLLYFFLAVDVVPNDVLCKVLNVEFTTNCEKLLRDCIGDLLFKCLVFIERDVWEIEFECEILASVDEESLNKKRILPKLEEAKEAGASVISTLSTNPENSSDGTPYAHLMCIPHPNTFESFEDAFRRLPQQEAFPLTDLYLKLKAPLECVSSLKQIISFTNYLTAQLSFRMLRKEASNQTIGQYLKAQPAEIRTDGKHSYMHGARFV